ncbi:TIGR00730 family Rossman fold protein [Oceanispirochaeta crateris]|uniref:Cytokinin riboside 5'-monophosphate phosphoribohydrolase n=1 Tax=Oceanispirochaeta crateris TaxID=2518645 RepID=A0A5C1QG86_9SPIO|nr:TIGR00730 family Rossman fold protein [Oceanispirochaeta crateris]QEN07183.1 TIGR00730 family Rossman fold protein [Oceanispirochaeta crateris]
MKSICVFCGSSTGSKAEYTAAAVSLGAELAQRKIRLVYGGGSVGLMGSLAQSVLDQGGQVLGIIPEAIHKKVAPLQGGQIIVVKDMHSRKMKMHEQSDGFIALPGGIGTYEELLEAYTWSQLGFHEKPVAILNTLGYYNSLIEQIEHSVREGFLKQGHKESLLIENDPQHLLEAMESHEHQAVDKFTDRFPGGN